MPLSNLKKILVAASTDPEFRMTLLENPDTVFADYDLAEEEKQCLREIGSVDQLEALCNSNLASSDYTASDIRI